MNKKNDYIAVFDSGVGGISVLKRLMAILPRERFLYYGDSANAPYGNRPEPEILALTLTAVEKTMAFPVKALVIACNTATAVAIDTLRQRYPDIPIVGIEPAVKPAAERFPGGHVGLLGTVATLKSERIHRLVARYSGQCQFHLLPAPGLARLVEQGKANHAEAEALLRELLAPYAGELDALILGCTHYPFATAALRRILGKDFPLLDGGTGTAARTKALLAQADLLGDGSSELIWQGSAPDNITLCQRLLATDMEL